MQKTSIKRIVILAAVMLLLTMAVLFLLRSAEMAETTPATETADIYINEIMASNSLYPNNDVLCDWIELYNPESVPVDVSGYGLSDETLDVKYTFPAGTVLPANGYLVVSCIKDSEDGAPFGISSQGGETLTLFNADHVAVDMVETEAVLRDQSQARQSDGSWEILDWATPGYANTMDGHNSWLAAHKNAVAPIRITEIMASNSTTIMDGYGEFSDWIELTNTGSETWDLTGWFLSDEDDDRLKWEFPAVELAAGQRLVIFCSGKISPEGEFHADFSLSRSSGGVYLTAPSGLVVHSVSYENLETDQSVVWDENDVVTATDEPTPGYENSPEGREAFWENTDRHGDLVISEAAVVNLSLLQQPDGGYYDWVELRNASDAPILLSRYNLKTNLNQPEGWQLPEVTLEPGQTYVLICSGDEGLSTRWYVHTPFALGAQEEQLYLFCEDGSLSDRVHLRGIPYGGTMGRLEGEAGFFYFETPTPGEPNKTGFRSQAAMPLALTEQGVYNDVSQLSIALEGEGTIRYTLDGSVPTDKSKKYTGPFVLEGTAVIRAVSFVKGKAASETATYSYILNENHDLPVVSLVCDPVDMFSKKGVLGVYYNSDDRNAQCDAHVAFFEEGGSFSQDCSVKLHGASSRESRSKKSMKLGFESRYGGHLRYDVFGNGEITGFSSLLLRTGTIPAMSILRDTVASAVAEKVSDTVLALDTRYCVLYINGDYWGTYSIREDYSKRYVADHTGSSPDSVSILRAPVKEPTRGREEFFNLVMEIERYGVADPARYESVAERLDMVAMADWMVLEAYFNNNDVAGNVRYIKGDNTDGKWRVAFFDFDLGLANSSSDWYKVFETANQIGRITSKLVENETFRALLIQRMCYLFDNGLNGETVYAVMDDYVGQIESESRRDFERWEDLEGAHPHYRGYDEIWNRNLEGMYTFFGPERTRLCIEDLDHYLTFTEEEWALLNQYM